MTHGNVGRPLCIDIEEQRPNDTNANGDRPEKPGDQRRHSQTAGGLNPTSTPPALHLAANKTTLADNK
jgi:hypothetical protein